MTTLPDLSRLRAWQAEAIRLYLSKPRTNFTVTATPGAGKTTFALTLAKHLRDTRVVDRIIVVVPTDHLRSQWASAAARLDLHLDGKLGNDTLLKAGYDGYVTTYAQVAAHPLLHERRTESPHRTFVILDEIHHAGDGLSWGDAVRQAFTPAARRLALTGTPFRTSPTERIPFVDYEETTDGLVSVADYSYAYREALNSAVVRPVIFAAYSGVARWSTSAGEVAASLTEDLTRDQEMAAWKTILDPKGEWVPHVLAAAAARLEETRAAGMPDAGMLVLASDQAAAKAYAKVLKSVTGTTPTLALSEDPKAGEKISAFANSHDKYLVAVRMVSEGVDIPRCAVLVWLTSYRTPLFFAQAVGRVVRSRRPGETATVFLPAVRPLLALAADIEESRNHILAAKPAPNEDELLAVEVDRPDDEQLATTDEYQALSSQAQFAHVLFSGTAITAMPEQPILVSGGSDSDGQPTLFDVPAQLTPSQTAAMLAGRDKDLRVGARQAAKAAGNPRAEARQQARHEQSAALRREIATLVNRLATRTGKPHSEVHVATRRVVPGPANADASLETLTRRRDWLLSKLH
jgi:superfamily II DNA or RNA helicase